MSRFRFSRRASIPRGPHATQAPRAGTFPQTVCVLLDGTVSLADLGRALAELPVAREAPGAPGAFGWALGGPSLIFPYRPEVNGFAQVDVVDQVWPDAMGSPKDETAPLFGAWAMGNFGPSTFPGALERAMQQARPEALRELAARHRAFLRIRLSYVFGADGNALVHPPDRDSIDELRFVTQLQSELLSLPMALCAFNPSGELLLARERIERALTRDMANDGLAVDAWVNVRMFRQRDAEGDWLVYDTVGMDQLGVRDHEAILPFTHPSTRHVPGLLYSLASYDAELGGVLGPNDTASDADGIGWRAFGAGEGRVQPPREVVRWSPQGAPLPSALRAESTN